VKVAGGIMAGIAGLGAHGQAEDANIAVNKIKFNVAFFYRFRKDSKATESIMRSPC
jgi:hypothetical protein